MAAPTINVQIFALDGVTHLWGEGGVAFHTVEEVEAMKASMANAPNGFLDLKWNGNPVSAAIPLAAIGSVVFNEGATPQ